MSKKNVRAVPGSKRNIPQEKGEKNRIRMTWAGAMANIKGTALCREKKSRLLIGNVTMPKTKLSRKGWSREKKH